MADLITLGEIEAARAGMPPEIRRTPLVPFSRDSSEVGAERLYLKLENLQVTGAYKPRAAFHILSSLAPAEKKQGVVMSSSGNFAQAFAFAGKRLGIPVVVVMMKSTSPYKVEAIRGYGTEIVFCEDSYAARKPMMEKVAGERGLLAINTAEDRRVAAGHAGIGMEIMDDMPDVDTVIVPCSSGGLIAGVASAVKLQNPNVRVVGVNPADGAAIHESLQAGEPVTLESWESMADGLAATRPGDFPFAHIKERVDDVVLVSEEEIAEAFRLLMSRGKILAEPSGAVAVAAWMTGKVSAAGKIVALISGGNVTSESVATLLAGKLPPPMRQ
jgi:threonine dehydratase